MVNGLPLHFAGDEALAHTGENTFDPTENLPHGNDQRGPIRLEIKALTRPSHKVRETLFYFINGARLLLFTPVFARSRLRLS